MNKEINEILQEIDSKIIPSEKWNKIKDYITDLQQENETLKEDNLLIKSSNKLVSDNLHNYKSRCEKAIEEYTKTYRTIYYTMKYYRDSKQIEKCDILYNDCIKKLDELDLLNILNGSDENE